MTVKGQMMGSLHSRIRRFVTVLTAVALLGLGGGPSGARAVAVPEIVVSGFDDAANEWLVDSGSASIASVSSPRTAGSAAMLVTYHFGAGPGVGIVTQTTPQELPGLPQSVSLDVYGDGSYNTAYVDLRDATGETFHYWLGNLNVAGWQTLSVDLASAPASHANGNRDGVLDLPVSIYQIVLYHNTGQRLDSSVVLDRLAYQYEDAQVPSATPKYIRMGGSTVVHGSFGLAGPFRLELADDAGATKSWATSVGAGSVDLGWDGRSDSGQQMRGSIRGRLSITRDGETYAFGIPYLAGLTLRPAASSTASFSGVNTFLNEIDTKDRSAAERKAAQMEQAYVRFARESFTWNNLERRRGYLDWAKFDQAVEVALAHNVAVLGRLEYSAAWASSAPTSVSSPARLYWPPANVADFAAYARATVRRYKDRVHHWEVWNEPNEANLWRPSPNAAAYTALLKAAYAAIKAEDPTATVLLGGLSRGPDQAFLNGIYANGGWSSFDVLAIHTYVAGPPDSSTSTFPVWLDMAAQTVNQKGWKPIWITEFGWSTYTGAIGVSEATQAAYILAGYRVAASRGVSGITLFSMEDYGTDRYDLVDNYGTITKSGRLKPSYATLACAGYSLDHGRPAACAVDRIAGADRYATAAAISANHHLAGVPVAYVATGLNFPDALAGAAAAGKVGAPLLLVTRDSVPASTAAELARLRPGRIIVLGATGVVSDATGMAAMSAGGL